MLNTLSKQWRIRLFIAMAVILTAAGGVLYWYKAFHIKTPAYAVQQVQQALEAHNEKDFYRYVDVDHILDTASAELVTGMVDNSRSLSVEAKSVIDGLAKIIKAPLISSCKELLKHYVLTGEIMSAKDAAGLTIDANQIIDRFGLRDYTRNEITSIEADNEQGTASATLRLSQQKSGEDFMLRLKLIQDEDGIWRIAEIANLQEFISHVTKARQQEVAIYLDETAVIQSRHDKSAKVIEDKMNIILKKGIIGNAALRQELSKLIKDELLADWQKRREELSAVNTPRSAQALQHLRLHICDARIAYAEGYMQWLKDQKPAALRRANEKLREVRTMEQEALLLVRQLQKRS